MIYAQNLLTIHNDLSNYKVSIYDLSGKTIVNASNLKNYNFSDFKNGIYIVTLTLKSGERKTIKVVKL